MTSKMHFDSEFSFEKSYNILSALSEEITNDRCLLNRIYDRSYLDIVSYDIDYSSHDAASSASTRQVLGLFQKNSSLPLAIDTAEVALGKFLEAEQKCLETNRKFRMPAGQRPDSALIFNVMRKISDILGPFPDLAELQFGFGPGANVGVSRFTSVRRKLSVRPSVTPGASKYLEGMISAFPHWSQLLEAEIQMSGKLHMVPKNAKTDRSIVIEPVINTFLQKGIGTYIRERLRYAGCNLNSQSKNQQGALIGSRDGSLATIDLAMASDTISRELVAAVLPYDWWVFLNDVRTEEVLLPTGEQVRLNKFSSMGNGFTFELESLIFFALCEVICDRGSFISVYGDDIVIPTKHAEELTEALDVLGFTVNTEKSFTSGPFRESCGKDFFGGVDIRPCYVKGKLSVKELFRLHNFFKRQFRDDLADFLLKYIPKRFHIFGPDGYGDGHLLGDHSTKTHKKSRGYCGYCFRTFSTKAYTRKDPCVGDYAAFLYQRTYLSPQVDVRFTIDPDGRLRPSEPEKYSSESLYSERTSNPRYKLRRIYVLR